MLNWNYSFDVPTKKERITFLTEKETREQLELWAEQEGRSLSNLIERIVLAALEEKATKTGN